MDARVRLRLRQWKASSSFEDQAFAMSEGIRYGELDPKMVQLAAFLGHPASKLIGDDVRPAGVVIKGVLVRNGDMRELAAGLSYFGRAAVLRINLSLVRMAFATRVLNGTLYPSSRRGPWANQLVYQSSNRNLNLAGMNWLRIRTFHMGVQGEEEGVGLPIYEWFTNADKAANGDKEALKTLKSYNSRDDLFGNEIYRWNVPYCVGVLNLTHEALCSDRARPKVLKFCNGIYDDETMLKFMRAEIYPWALGEFAEEVAPAEFIAHPPFVSRR